ncbi:hypothetical protein A8L45_09235 [Veronia pacifica]|uniref:EAL domain-containing protein n=2 Tax=Veronia pacifica TaxID=1080227 RepID=A0A1C3EKQ7_9GAMM|nr:hypothetical protein A8L45_09235 [Veronia pacifica]
MNGLSRFNPLTKELMSQQDFEVHLNLEANGDVTASYENVVLSSVFQPIIDRQREVIGFEALCRIYDSDGNPICCSDIFCQCYDKHWIIHQRNLDKLTRVIHLRNFSKFESTSSLFLNVLPQSAIHWLKINKEHGLITDRINELGLNINNVVFEMVEHESEDDKSLAIAAAKRLSSGFQIAIDDYGVNASQEDRVRSIRPNILKIDRSVLLQYMAGDKEWLLHSIELANDVGAKTLIEGIESQEQFSAMLALNIDYYQGYFLGEPQHLSAYCEARSQ